MLAASILLSAAAVAYALVRVAVHVESIALLLAIRHGQDAESDGARPRLPLTLIEGQKGK